MSTKKSLVRFNLRQYSIEKGLHKATVQGGMITDSNAPVILGNHLSFEKICTQFSEEMKKEFDQIAETKEGSDMVDLETNAIIAKKEYVTAMLERIERFLATKKFRDISIPEYYKDIHLYSAEEQRKYSNLAHAIFHEQYGLNALAYWATIPESYAMQVIGRKIWIHDPIKGRPVRMDFELSSEEVVEKIIRVLQTHKPQSKVNHQIPTLELDMFTGERVSIMIEPRVKRKVITFRRVLRKNVGLYRLCYNDNLFPGEAYALLQGISKTMPNTAISGPMGTGKTTLIKALIHEREDHITGISIENDYEIQISIDNPNKKFIEMILNGTSFEDALEKALRTDADYGVIQEIRMFEAEGAMIMCERLQKGFLTSTHIWQTETIPQQWARLICKNGGGDQQAEEKRVAEYLDFIILLQMDETKTVKWIQSIEEIRYNRQNGEISTHQIMRRNPETEQYEYRFDISKKLQNEMKSKNKKWATTFIDTLQQLELQSPIPEGEGVNIFNPAIANPQYRLALATEKLVEAQERTAHAMEKISGLLEQLLNSKEV